MSLTAIGQVVMMTVTSKSNLARRSLLRLDEAKIDSLWRTPTQAKLVHLKADRNAVEIEAFSQSGLRLDVASLHRQSGRSLFLWAGPR